MPATWQYIAGGCMAEARKTLKLELNQWEGKELATGLYTYSSGLPS